MTAETFARYLVSPAFIVDGLRLNPLSRVLEHVYAAPSRNGRADMEEARRL